MLVFLSAKLMIWLWGLGPITDATKTLLVVFSTMEMVLVGMTVGALVLSWFVGDGR